MNKVYYIYKLTAPNDKIYIGQTANIKQRFNYYKNNKCVSQTKLYNSIKKYHWNNFNKEILSETSEKYIDEHEKIWILWFDSMENGLNCEGGGNKNKILSEETKKKISESKMGIKLPHNKKWNERIKIALTGKKHSKERILKRSIYLTGKIPWNKGRTGIYTEEVIEKMRIAKLGKISPRKGVKLSEDTKRKISNSNKGNKYCLGRKCSEETKQKIRVGNIGKILSEETKRKISVALTGKKHLKK